MRTSVGGNVGGLARCSLVGVGTEHIALIWVRPSSLIAVIPGGGRPGKFVAGPSMLLTGWIARLATRP